MVDEVGGAWTDVSAWYWASVRDRTHRPWWAVTVAAATAPGDTAAMTPLAPDVQ
jgi:hypothetical protein